MLNTMQRLALCIFIFGLAEVNGSVAPRSPIPSVDLAQKQLADVHIKARGVGALLARLSLSYDIPIGLEIARNDDESAIYRLDLPHGTVADLMTQFVTAYDQYDWEIGNGVVSVFPKNKDRDPVVAQLLATELAGFSVKEKTSCWALGDALVATPEIRRILETNRMTYSAGYIGGFYIQQLGQHFTLNVSQMRLKSILDKVVKESPVAKIWIVKRDSSAETLLLRLNARLENAPKNNLKGEFLETSTDELPEH